MLKDTKPAPHDFVKESDHYEASDHSAEYRRAKELFIAFINDYNKIYHCFSGEVRKAVREIHWCWKSKYHPANIARQFRPEHHHTLISIAREYCEVMKSFTYYEDLKGRVLYYRQFLEPKGLPFDNTVIYPGPTGPA